MVKTLREKMLERRIARLEKLVASNRRHKFESNVEDHYDYIDTYTLGDVLAKNQNMPKKSKPIDVIAELAADIGDLGLSNLDRIADSLNVDNEDATDWILANWNSSCKVRVSGNRIHCICDGEPFTIL